MASERPNETSTGRAQGSGYGQTVVAVFRTRAQADEVARLAVHMGMPPRGVRIDRAEDEVAAIHGEMREEIEHAIMAPGPVGPFTKEMTKGLARAVPVGVVAGMVLAFPLAFIPMSGLSLIVRILIALGVGAAAGGTAGLVAGGGFGAKGPAEPVAAARGVTVRFDCPTREEADRLADRLRAFDPIRVDLMTSFAQPAQTVATEEERE